MQHCFLKKAQDTEVLGGRSGRIYWVAWIRYRVAKKNNTKTNQNDIDTNDIFGKSLMHNYL